MMTEEFEFLISQYADGTLDADQAEGVRVRIESDPAARAVLAGYRRIDGLLAERAPMPAIDFARLRAGIGDAIDAETGAVDGRAVDGPAVAGRIGPGSRSPFASLTGSWKIWSSLAAAVVICVTAASLMHGSSAPNIVSPAGRKGTPADVAVAPKSDPIVVAGPTVEAPTGTPVEQITVGPSPAYAARDSAWQYADDGVVVHPSTVRIADAPVARPKPH